jgi:hypothetical protein
VGVKRLRQIGQVRRRVRMRAIIRNEIEARQRYGLHAMLAHTPATTGTAFLHVIVCD